MRRVGALLLAPLLAVVLSSCGRSTKEQLAATYCPEPFTVQDAQRLTRFKPGPGRDPRDILFEATLGRAGTQCAVKRDRLEIDLRLLVAVNAGPSMSTGTASVPYFVRLVDSSGTVREGRDFNADFKLSAANPRGQSMEELSLSVLFASPSDLGAYRIAVGLKPTPEELQYNRRAEGR